MQTFAFSTSIVICSIILHGHFPDNLLKSAIISFPKDAKPYLSNVDNYRGISLSNSINKVFDYVIIELYQVNLLTYCKLSSAIFLYGTKKWKGFKTRFCYMVSHMCNVRLRQILKNVHKKSSCT